MSRKTDNLVARHEYILRRLQEMGGVEVDELCNTLGASIATIRPDLENLEGRSLLKRTRGGAVPIGPLFYEPFRHDSSFQDKVNSFTDEKRRTALAAAGLVTTGQTVALSGGTTTTELVRCLRVAGDRSDGDNVAGRLRVCGDDKVVADVDRLHDTAVYGLANLVHAHLTVEGDLQRSSVGNGEGDGARLSRRPGRGGWIGRALCRQIDSGGEGDERDEENAEAAHSER